MQRNISDWERAGSIIAAAAIGALAVSRREQRTPAAALAGGLLLRGVTGYCPVSALAGRTSRLADTRDALGGSSGVHVLESIVVARPVDEVFRFWRVLSNLPRFMRHLERVEELDRTRSRWTARGPAGTRVNWDAHIINEVPNEVIGWQSVGDADVISAGSVHFKPTPQGGTEIVVHLQYEPPAGKVGAWFASLFGEEPSQQIRDDLRRLKTYLETGSHSEFPSHTTDSGHVLPFENV